MSKRDRNKNKRPPTRKLLSADFHPPSTDSGPIVVANQMEAEVLRSIRSSIGNGANEEVVKRYLRSALPSISSCTKMLYIAKTIGYGRDRRDVLRSFFEIADKQISLELRKSKEAPACGSGCNHCCKNMHITFCEDEAAQIANAINNLSEFERRKIKNRLTQLNATGSGVPSGQCALLDDSGKCSIYDDRPITCRAYHSTSAIKCHERLTRGSNITKFVSEPFPFDRGILHSFLTILGVRRNQYSYEMNQFLKRLLFHKNRLEAWSKGELVDESDIAVSNPKHPDEILRKSIPLILIEEVKPISKQNRIKVFFVKLMKVITLTK